MRCQLASRKPFGNSAARNSHFNRHVVVARAEAAEASDTPAHKDASEWYAHLKAEFDPVSSAPPTTAVLDFEKPLVELDRRIREVRSIVDPIALPGLLPPERALAFPVAFNNKCMLCCEMDMDGLRGGDVVFSAGDCCCDTAARQHRADVITAVVATYLQA